MPQSDGIKPLSVADLRHDAEQLTLDQMRERYGAAFLLYHGGVEALDRPVRAGQTQYFATSPAAPGATPAPPQPTYLVFAVKTTGRSPFPNFISVGRTGNNDVVIEDASLSKFHAYLRQGDGGEFSIQDAGSRNGTFVDDVPVPTRERGSPTTLHPGARVRLGRVDLVFLRCEELCNLVRMMPKR